MVVRSVRSQRWAGMVLARRSQSSGRYCPTCRRRRGDEAELCPECGDRTHGRGYCRVCEDRIDARVGEPCPKHETPLEPGPPTSMAAVPGAWVTVQQYPYLSLAIAPRLRLEAEGIPTFLDGERVAAEVAYAVATGGVRIQVPETMAPRALEILGLPPRTRNVGSQSRRVGPLATVALTAAVLFLAALTARLLLGP